MLQRTGRRGIAVLLVLCLLFSIVLPSTVQASGDSSYRNLAAGLSYSIDGGAAESGALTNGVYIGTNIYAQGGSKGFQTSEGNTKVTSIVFNLGELKSIDKVSSNFINNDANAFLGTYVPNEVKYYQSNDGLTWNLFYTDNPSSIQGDPVRTQQSIWENEGAISTQYIKVEITQDKEWVFTDEIEIWGTDSQPVLDDTYKNLSLGKNYLVDGTAESGALTNGLYNGTNIWSGAWRSFQTAEGNTKVSSIVFDLGGLKSIDKVLSNFINCDNGTYAGVYLPEEVKYYSSEDGETWSLFYTDNPSSVQGATTRTQLSAWENQGVVIAQYIKVQITQDKEWVFTDEIEIWGYDDYTKPVLAIIPSTKAPTTDEVSISVTTSVYDSANNGIQELKWAVGSQDTSYFATNGIDMKATSIFAVQQNGKYTVYVKDMVGRETTKEVEITNIIEAGYRNLVLGGSYTVGDKAGNGALTNGIYNGFDIWTGAWESSSTAEGTTKETAVVFDLGAIKSIDKVSLSYVNCDDVAYAGVYVPKEVKYYYSEDGATWNQFYTENSAAVIGPKVRKQTSIWENSGAVYAKYIKIELIQDKEWLFYDEVEIWGNDGTKPILAVTPSTTGIAEEIVFSVTTNIYDNGNNEIAELKWAAGTQDVSYFAAEGTDIKATSSFAVQQNGMYSIYAKDTLGNEVVKTVEVKNVVPEGYSNLAAGLDYTSSTPASETYPDSGKELTDGKFGSIDRKDVNWQGYRGGPNVSLVFDLGEGKSIQSIKANFLRVANEGIFYPIGASYYVSNDGVIWSNIANVNSKNALWGDGPHETDNMLWDGTVKGVPGSDTATMAYGRYVKVEFIPESWAFIDEVEILGYDGQKDGAVEVAYAEPSYLAPGPESGNIRDLVLLYNGQYDLNRGDWTKDELIPYIAYVDEDGKALDWFYDGILYLGISTDTGKGLGSPVNAADKAGWQWYLDKTFAENGDLDELSKAVEEVSTELGQNDHKVKVVLTLPYPSFLQKSFGDVDGDGISENLSFAEVGNQAALDNSKKVIKWYLDQLYEKWDAAAYTNLELSGIYWMNENIENESPIEADMIRYASSVIHENALKFYWIPNWFSNQTASWKDMGMDAVTLQMNHFFFDGTEYRVEWGAHRALQAGIGLEMEIDERLLADPEFMTRFKRYLNGGIEYGYMDGAFKAYYQGNDTLLKSAFPTKPEQREAYDLMYQFVSGTYEAIPIISLYPSTTEPVSEPITVTINASTAGVDNKVEVVKWADGDRATSYFATEGNVVDLTNTKFTASKKGIYTVYIKDTQGKETVRTISITNIIPEGLKNLAPGSTCVVTPTFANGGSILTDGVFGGTNPWNALWVKHQYVAEGSFVFDLGSLKTVQQINTNVLSVGYGINYPDKFTYSYSEDGENWTNVAEILPPQDITGALKVMWDGELEGVPGKTGDTSVVARYIKVQYNQDLDPSRVPPKEWTFIDEIEIFGFDEVREPEQPGDTGGGNTQTPEKLDEIGSKISDITTAGNLTDEKAKELIDLVKAAAGEFGKLTDTSKGLEDIMNIVNKSAEALKKANLVGKTQDDAVKSIENVSSDIMRKLSTITVANSTISVEEANKIIAGMDTLVKTAGDLKSALTDVKSKLKFENTLNVVSKSDKVELPASLLNAADKKKIDSITISTAVAEISIRPDAITAKDGSKVLVSANKLEVNSLNDSMKAVVGTNPVYEFDALVDGTKVAKFNKQVEVSIPYTPELGSDPKKVTIFYITDDGKLQNVVGMYDETTKSVTFKTKHFSKYMVKQNNVTFGDIQSITWAKDKIEVAAAKGIVSGIGGNKFNPQGNITRAEFAAMLVNALNLQDSEAVANFSDVKTGNWFYDEVASAVKAGIIEGLPDGRFAPNDSITREQMAVMLAKAIEKLNVLSAEKLDKFETKHFVDNAKVSAYAKNAVELVSGYSLMSGVSGDAFAPKDSATRAMAAVVIYKLIME